MFDPLGSTASIFADDDATPSWSDTPQVPTSPVLTPRPATYSPAPPTPDKGPSDGIYGKEPQIYGRPEPGLISPSENVGSNGEKFEKPEPYLRARITGLDRNKRDILIKLDAQTNLSNFTGTTYRNVSRSYAEFQQFYEALVHSNPQTIVPALPLAQTSAPTDEEDDRLVRIMLQRWITRVCEDPIILADEDLRAFIESDFGYQPTPRPRRKASSGFSLIRRAVPDEDEDLQRARFELTKLEGQFFDTAKAIDKLAVARKALAMSRAEMGNKLVSVAATEAHSSLANVLRKIGRTWHSLSDLDQAQALSECVVVGDSFGYQGMNSRSAKETLQQRTGVLEEYQAAVKATISKRRHIERLKASTNIKPERVDEAIEDMEEANKYEQVLARRADGISKNLHQALRTWNRHANEDINTALIEHARSSIMYEKQLLRELEALRPEVRNAANKVVPTNGVPKPIYVPPLEDYSRPVLSPPPDPQPRVPAKPQSPPKPSSPTADGPPPPTPKPPRAPNTVVIPSKAAPQPDPINRPSADEPPLGGRLIEGTKSMFIKPPSTPSPRLTASLYSPSNIRPSATPSPLATSPTDPLLGTPIGAPSNGHLEGRKDKATVDLLDPLAQQRVNVSMSQSLRIQPIRPRLDPREAASKLANLF